MSTQHFLLTLLAAFIFPTTVLGDTEQRHKPDFYLNPALGFNVEGYHYSQAEFPCEIDSVLVKRITDYAESAGLDVQVGGVEDTPKNANAPILAIDIEALTLSEDFSFGKKSRGNLPSAQVVAALIGKHFPEGMVSAEHSCAITSLNEFTSSSSVLDMGTYGVTVCSATHKCLGRLARDIVKWAKPQLK